jgi:hypothetical protein
MKGMFLAIVSLALMTDCVTRRAQASGLELTVKFDKQQYVVREPIRAEVTLTNVSSDTVRIMEARSLGANMEYVHMEIETPDGNKQVRRHAWYVDEKSSSPGEPLGPGSAVLMLYYVTLSGCDSPAAVLEPLTFPSAGRYRVVFVYSIRDDLFKRFPIREVRSAPVALDLRMPNIPLSCNGSGTASTACVTPNGTSHCPRGGINTLVVLE